VAFVFAPAGVGLVAGSVVMPRILQRMSKEHAIFLGILVLAGTIVLLPLSYLLGHYMDQQGLNSKLIYLGAVPFFMFIAGVAIDFINIPAQTAIQESTPEWIKGRVLALQLMLYNAFSIPILLFIGGIADTFGIDKVIYLVSVIIICFGLWGRFYERKHKGQDTRGDVLEEKAKLSEPESVKR
jgi:MFS family permease